MYNCAKKRCMISINVISYLKCTLLLILEWVSHYLGEKEKYKSKSNCYRWFLHIHFLHGLRNELRKNYEIKRLSIIFAYASNSLALMAGYDRVERLTKTLPLRKIIPLFVVPTVAYPSSPTDTTWVSIVSVAFIPRNASCAILTVFARSNKIVKVLPLPPALYK